MKRPRDTPVEPPGREAALEIALHFLGSRPRTRWELARRLARTGTAEDVIEATLGRLEAMGYVNDSAFVRWWVEQRDRHSPRGRRMIEAELRQRGVPRDVIAAHVPSEPVEGRAREDETLPGTDQQRAAVALERHLRGRPLPTEPRALQRVGMFLVRRGFDPETARSAIRAASRTEPEDG